MTPHRKQTESPCQAPGEPERWFSMTRHRSQTPLSRLTTRERFELLSAVGKLERTAARHLSSDARNWRLQVREKLAQESAGALAESLAGHSLHAWQEWTAQALTKPTPELLWQMLVALDDAEAAVAVVAGIQPGAITPGLDELLSTCRTWIEGHAELFAPLRNDVEKLCATLQPDLDEQNYDLAVTTLKFEAILDPLPRHTSAEPVPLTPALLDALLRKSR